MSVTGVSVLGPPWESRSREAKTKILRFLLSPEGPPQLKCTFFWGGALPMKQLSSPPGAPALQAHFQVPQDPPRREESLLLRPRRTQRSPWTAARRCLLKTATRLAGRVCTSQGNTGQEEDTNYRRTLLSSLLDKQRATGFPRLPDTKWPFAGRCVCGRGGIP